MIKKFQSVYLNELSYYVPDRRVSNQEIIDQNSLRIKNDWIVSRIGIRERRWAEDGVAASDLALKAIQKMKSLPRDGSVWVSTISQDFLTPSTSSILKGKLKLSDSSPAFDMSAACAGHIFALEQAALRIEAQIEKNALVVATEVRSRYLNKSDRRTVFLFGDGAAAFGISDHGPGLARLEWTLSQTQASPDYEILVPGGGSAHPITEESIKNGDQYIRMNDGAKIAEVTSEQLVTQIQAVLENSGASISDYDFFAFHQGNGSVIRAICGALGVPLEKTHINFDKFGNSSGASVGIALAEAQELKLIPPNAKVLMVAMGAGYHLGMASLQFGSGAGQ